MSRDAEKRAAARAAAELVEDGMALGLGTGSTVRHLLDALAERQPEVTCVATSAATEGLAAAAGLRLVGPGAVDRLDLTIDGADEVDPSLNLTKGGGGAHVREKIVARMSERFVVIVDSGKLVPRLGPFGTPIELLAWARGPVERALARLGAKDVALRGRESDDGNPLGDAHFGTIADPAALAAALDAIPGIVGHGIFPGSWVERALIGEGAGVREIVGGKT